MPTQVTCKDCGNKERVLVVFVGYECPKCKSKNYKMRKVKDVRDKTEE
jgi:Zn finger protein HypA/HybF involved in hydrogenase expression